MTHTRMKELFGADGFLRGGGLVKYFAVRIGIGLAVGVLLVKLLPSSDSNPPAQSASIESAQAALKQAASASTGQFDVEINASRESASGGELVTLLAAGPETFKRDSDGGGEFQILLKGGTLDDTASVSVKNGEIDESSNPKARAGDLGPDSLGTILRDSAQQIAADNSEADSEGVVSKFSLPAAASGNAQRALLDLVMVRPEGREVLAGFTGRDNLPVQAEIYTNQDQTLREFALSYTQSDPTELNFTVRIKPS